MELLAATLQQRLIGGVLNQGMLKGLARSRRQAALIDEFRFDELLQPLL